MKKTEILLIDDDCQFGGILKKHIENESNNDSYKVTFCSDGEDALYTFFKNPFDACILDISLPDVGGCQLVREFRNRNEFVTIIMMSAIDNINQKREAFTAGADDYMIKPFPILEIILRLKAHIRRKNVYTALHPITRVGNLVIDSINLTAWAVNTEIKLSEFDLKIIQYLSENINNVIRKEELLNVVFQRVDFFASRELDIFFRRLSAILQKTNANVYLKRLAHDNYTLTLTPPNTTDAKQQDK